MGTFLGLSPGRFSGVDKTPMGTVISLKLEIKYFAESFILNLYDISNVYDRRARRRLDRLMKERLSPKGRECMRAELEKFENGRLENHVSVRASVCVLIDALCCAVILSRWAIPN